MGEYMGMGKMLKTIGYAVKRIPFIPFSGWTGDNLIAPPKDPKSSWFKGWSCNLSKKEKVTGMTLKDAFDSYVKPPKRPEGKRLYMPLSGCFKIGGVGDVLTGRVEQGALKPGDLISFVPKRMTKEFDGKIKVFTIEQHHKNLPSAECGDNVGMNIKGLPMRLTCSPSPVMSSTATRRVCSLASSTSPPPCSSTTTPASSTAPRTAPRVATARSSSCVPPSPPARCPLSTGRRARSPPVTSRSRCPPTSRLPTPLRSPSPPRSLSSSHPSRSPRVLAASPSWTPTPLSRSARSPRLSTSKLLIFVSSMASRRGSSCTGAARYIRNVIVWQRQQGVRS